MDPVFQRDDEPFLFINAAKIQPAILTRTLHQLDEIMYHTPMLPKRFKHFHRMMHLLKIKWLELIFPAVLVAITVVISALNYSSGTWLTGWDTLHPEFDFQLNIEREFFGAWRGDQGLGAVAAHAHMSELPRVLTLWVLHLFLPLSTVRYSYIFLCFIVGPLGIYFFARSIFVQKKTKEELLIANSSAFVSALLYIFNLATVQQFFVVFEMFAVQYAALGWLFWLGTRLVKSPSKRDYFWFFVVCLLSSSIAYASMLWLATGMCFGLYIFALTLLEQKKHRFRTLLSIATVLFIANAYWLLPNLYFLFSGASQNVVNSHTNQLFSQEAFIQNQEYGTFIDLALLKNFLFSWQVYDFQHAEFVPLLSRWATHIQKPLVQAVGFFISFTAIAGLLVAIIQRKKIILAMIPMLLLTIFMLINANPPFDHIFVWLRSHSSIFEESLRFPFTKFVFLYVVSVSILVGSFTHSALSTVRRYRKVLLLTTLITILGFSSALTYLGWPTFQGQLIAPAIRQNIPDTYFGLFAFMKTQPAQARAALLPAFSPTGWQYQKWGYQGPGFLWFGMSQPLLTRDFDRWNQSNETFYEQLSTALYGLDDQAFQNTVDQYQVQYLIYDQSLVNPTPGQSEMSTSVDIPTIMKKLDYTKIWQDDFLSVYQTNVVTQTLSSPETTQNVSTTTERQRHDHAYADTHSYVESSQQEATVTYPFASLNTVNPENVSIKQTNIDHIVAIQMKGRLSQSKQQQELVLPALAKGNSYTTLAQVEFVTGSIRVEFITQNSIQIGSQTILLPQLPPVFIAVPDTLKDSIVTIGNTPTELSESSSKIVPLNLTVGEPITVLVFDQEKKHSLDLSEQFSKQRMQECWRGSDMGSTGIAQTDSQLLIRYNNAAACQSLYLLDTQEQSYFAKVSLPYQPIQDATPYTCVVSKNTDYQCLETPKTLPEQSHSVWETTQFGAILSPHDQYWIDLKAQSDSLENKDHWIAYKTPQVEILPLATFALIPSSAWNVFESHSPTVISEPAQNIQVNFLADERNLLSDDTLKSFFQNCEPDKKGHVSQQRKDEALTLAASDNGIACKAFALSDVSQHSSHLIFIEGKNDIGRSLKLYMYNQASNHLDLEELLPSHSFSSIFSLPGLPHLGEPGYTFSLETRSFGRIASTNTVTKLAVYTLPLDWISQITVRPHDFASIQNPLKIKTLDQFGLWGVKTIVHNTETQGTVVLNQAYAPGWIALRLRSGQAFRLDFEHIQNFVQLLPHSRYNGWANAWIIEQGVKTNNQAHPKADQPLDETSQLTNPTSQGFGEASQTTLYIFYWPQLLEFMGFGLILGVLIFFAILRYSKTSKIIH